MIHYSRSNVILSEVFKLMNPWIVVLIVIGVMALVLFILYRVGLNLQKKQAQADEQMATVAQTISMLVIDKKKMKLTESGLPQLVIDQTPKYLRRSKVPIVKAKVGPKIMSFMCDPKVFELIPVKKEVKAVVSGIYISNVKGLRTGLDKKEKVKFSDRIKGAFRKKEAEPVSRKGSHSRKAKQAEAETSNK